MTIEVSEVKKRLVSILGDPARAVEYIRQYGPVIHQKNIEALRADIDRRSHRREENTPEGDDPVFTISFVCPVCNQGDIVGYELLAKSQSVTQNKFLVPIYKGAGSFRTVDYTLLHVTVCPRCLFASPDKKDFGRPAGDIAAEAKSQLPSNVIISLQEKIGERKAMIGGITNYKSYFERPRSDHAAIDSYRLAMTRAKAESDHDLPYTYFKIGSYALRIAKILKDSQRNNTEVLNCALSNFEEAFIRSDCPSEEIEIQAIYLIVALSAKLGEHRKAKTYTSAFNSLYGNNKTRENQAKKESTAPPAMIALWKDRMEFVRDSLDDPDYFKDE